jgi:sec-independent protein translocase protein TatB
VIDFGFDKIAIIGAVALIVIGPEKLPKVARTMGHLFGKAQRYVAEVKAEVNRSMELDELKKMKTEFETAARDVSQSVSASVAEAGQAIESEWRQAQAALGDPASTPGYEPPPPSYRHPKKNWRLKRGALPQWYRRRLGVRSHAQSGAARVARFRPPSLKSRP